MAKIEEENIEHIADEINAATKSELENDDEFGAELEVEESEEAKKKISEISIFKEDDEKTEDSEKAEDSGEEKATDEAQEDKEPMRISNVVLSLNPDERIVSNLRREEEGVWHDLTNAYMHKKPLTGIVESLERLDGGYDVVTTSYMGQRIIIPLNEMGILVNSNENETDEDINIRKAKLANGMLGAEIDFVIAGMDKNSKSVVASRKAAMLEKKRKYYVTPNADGRALIYPGRKVEARILGVAEKKVRIEVFGVEVSVHARNMSWQWIADATEHYHVGEKLLVLVEKVEYPEGNKHNEEWLNGITIEANAKALLPNLSAENFEKCNGRGKYIGEVTDIHNGTFFLCLNNGVNAIAHSVSGSALPLKKDKVAFACTRKDPKNNVVLGIITRVIQTGNYSK